MESPQLENGYTRFANEWFERLLSLRLPGQEIRIVLAVIRKTYGYGKKKDNISYGQLAKITNIPRPRVIQHVKSLVSKKVLGSLNNGTREPLTIWFNKHYSQWKPSPKKETSPNKETIDSLNKETKSSLNKETHKRKKEIITKETCGDSEESPPADDPPKKKKDPRVKVFIDWYCERYENRFGKKHIFKGGKDAKLIKDLLATVKWKDLLYSAIAYLIDEDAFCVKNGHNIGTFSSRINSYTGKEAKLKAEGYDEYLIPEPGGKE
jgi:phage replication O-like protein O